ncbi:Histidine-rich glycoprotein, partial [Galemys pyrenaicus]
QDSWAVSPENCDTTEPLAGKVLDLINKGRRDGYLFQLLRVADAHLDKTESRAVYYLVLDVKESDCSVLSRKHWDDCKPDVSQRPSEIVIGQCKVIATTHSTDYQHLRVKNFNCTTSSALTNTKDSPVFLDFFEDTHLYREQADKALEKFKGENADFARFRVDQVERVAQARGGEGTKYYVDFSVRNCSGYHFPRHFNAFGFCRADLSYNVEASDLESPIDIVINCEVFNLEVKTPVVCIAFGDIRIILLASLHSSTMDTEITIISTNHINLDPFIITVPVDTVPMDTVPMDMVPMGTVPLDMVPLNTVPMDTVPMDMVPMGMVPLDMVPMDTVPMDTVPMDTVPMDMVPIDTIPMDIMDAVLTTVPMALISMILDPVTHHPILQAMVPPLQAMSTPPPGHGTPPPDHGPPPRHSEERGPDKGQFLFESRQTGYVYRLPPLEISEVLPSPEANFPIFSMPNHNPQKPEIQPFPQSVSESCPGKFKSEFPQVSKFFGYKSPK